MTHTHGGAGTSHDHDGDDDLLAPPHPTPAKMMAQLLETQRSMGEVLCGLAQNVGRGQGWDQHQGPEPNQFSDFKDFLDTKPPIFKEVEEPLQVDEWLNTIEQKFCLLRVTEHMKAEYASHQLHGLADIWWTHYLSTLPANAQVTWNEFKATFMGIIFPQVL